MHARPVGHARRTEGMKSVVLFVGTEAGEGGCKPGAGCCPFPFIAGSAPALDPRTLLATSWQGDKKCQPNFGNLLPGFKIQEGPAIPLPLQRQALRIGPEMAAGAPDCGRSRA